MTRRRVFTIVAALLVLFACFDVGKGMFWLPAIASHHGDGEFHDLSRRAVPFAIPGYSVTMPEFDLGKPHRAEYRVGGLANIGRKCGVHLAIRDHNDRWWGDTRDVGGKVKLDLLDSQGRTVVSVTGRLGDYIWWGFSDLHVLYQMEKSFFNPNSDEEYSLRFEYEPDPRLEGYKGFVYVRSGGNK
jgi:hypothetical protein